MRARYEKHSEEVAGWQQTLCHLIEYSLIYGLPIHSLEPRPHFKEEIRQARNTEEALIVTLNAVARVTGKVSEIAWESPETFGALASRLQAQRTGSDNTLAFTCFSYLKLDNCVLYVKDFFHSTLHRSSLVDAKLILADLSLADLSRANLSSADLSRANLSRADLSRANLSSANLRGAILDNGLREELSQRDDIQL